VDVTALSTIVQTTIGLLVFGLICFWLWPGVRVDSFRQNLFALRDDLFDYAASGQISFQHPAYRLLRQSMNGFIRYAHRIGVFQIVMTVLIRRVTHPAKQEYDWTRKWEQALESVKDREVRTRLEEFHSRVGLMVAERVVLGSPLLISLLVAVLAADLFRRGWKSAQGAFRDAVVEAAARAVDPRVLEEEAMRAAA
jgi:hypothetical protein